VNEKKWTDPKVPMTLLALKLSEEAAEVGGEITDALVNGRPVDRIAILEELDHTVFIANTMRYRIMADEDDQHQCGS
jgi:hypothetical protein